MFQWQQRFGMQQSPGAVCILVRCATWYCTDICIQGCYAVRVARDGAFTHVRCNTSGYDAVLPGYVHIPIPCRLSYEKVESNGNLYKILPLFHSTRVAVYEIECLWRKYLDFRWGNYRTTEEMRQVEEFRNCAVPQILSESSGWADHAASTGIKIHIQFWP
jgi:hypothetical protein